MTSEPDTEYVSSSLELLPEAVNRRFREKSSSRG
jgi:hypothetical protein